MRNSLVLVGIGVIVIIVGGVYAFKSGFIRNSSSEEYVSSYQKALMRSTLSLTSTAFENDASIPSKYTCDGSQVNPPLMISGVPANARSVVLIMDDPDIPDEIKRSRGIEVFDHWILFNIPVTTTEVAEGAKVGTLGANGTGKPAYTSPCPPKEYEPTEHRYFFKLYALDTELPLEEGASRADIEKVMEGHIVDQTKLIGLYKRI